MPAYVPPSLRKAVSKPVDLQDPSNFPSFGTVIAKAKPVLDFKARVEQGEETRRRKAAAAANYHPDFIATQTPEQLIENGWAVLYTGPEMARWTGYFLNLGMTTAKARSQLCPGCGLVVTYATNAYCRGCDKPREMPVAPQVIYEPDLYEDDDSFVDELACEEEFA